jgi:uncharacterized membrane protein YeaQ/YmgE (transglycosylase-associated protein family)
MIVILLVGVAAGFLVGKVARGSGAGLVGDAAIGIVGALIANWLLPRFHIHLVGGLAGLIVDSAIGATLLLLMLRLVGASAWGGGRESSTYRR